MARKGDTSEYVRRMQMELFDVLCKATRKKELREVEPLAQEVREKCMQRLDYGDVRDLAVHRWLSRVTYSKRCAEASAVKAYQKRGFSFAPDMEIGYVVRNAAKLEVDRSREDASGFDAGYYGKLLEKACEEVSFAIKDVITSKSVRISLSPHSLISLLFQTSRIPPALAAGKR